VRKGRLFFFGGNRNLPGRVTSSTIGAQFSHFRFLFEFVLDEDALELPAASPLPLLDSTSAERDSLVAE
jgi:hypothetical protein